MTKNADQANPDPMIVVISSERLMMAAYCVGQGKSFEEVAEMVGMSIHHLRPIMNMHGIRGRNVGRGASRLDIVITNEARPLITTASALRGIEAVEIVEKIVRLVFTDPELLKNILDDQKPVM